jgi:outer membrane protein OmpA-like peptidoglycan-associated protein
MNRRTSISVAALSVLIATGVVVSCGTSRKADDIRQRGLAPQLVLPGEDPLPEMDFRKARRDTLTVRDESGQEILIMKAVRDDETGEMVATDVLDAAVITARFRNVAERGGRVDLRFQIIVPGEMQDPAWQLRFTPDMYILGDSTRLESVIITGEGYRKAQLKGYEQYERFLSKIVSDTTRFIDIGQLEIFLERNIPQVFAFKADSSEVSDERFLSAYGVSEREALEHYTDRVAVRRNRRRIASQEKMYRKYVKAPIVTEGVRLDTVILTLDGDFVYEYVQTVATRPKLRKVDIVLSGSIFEEDRPVYVMPRSEPLSFYISSVSSFADGTERYLTRVVSRRAEANASYRIEFARGKSDIDPSLADNLSQIGFVKDNLDALLANDTFNLDSIVVVANASPEGSWVHNGSLSRRRGEAVSRYFSAFMRERRREAALEGGFSVDESGKVTKEIQFPEIRFITRSVPENWSLLDRLVRNDDVLTDAQKEHYFSLEWIRDADGRETMMRNRDYYRHLADSLYPKLRVVDFAFHLHRRGMVKDTLHTTELDTAYMRGVQLLRDMDYNEAVKILGPYRDFNAALAYVACDRNASALDILTRLEKTAPVNYLLAIVRARQGDEQAAVEHYLRSCAQDPSLVHRGNLDPEISALIRLYGLNQQTEEP